MMVRDMRGRGYKKIKSLLFFESENIDHVVRRDGKGPGKVSG